MCLGSKYLINKNLPISLALSDMVVMSKLIWDGFLPAIEAENNERPRRQATSVSLSRHHKVGTN